MWYPFQQNNSGGAWIGPQFLLIGAADEASAVTIAQHNGVYFDGVDAGIDCACCGDRWCEPSGATEEPMLYNKSVREYRSLFFRGMTAQLIHADGSIENIELKRR